MSKVELVFILDRSGSMGGLELDTIGGFNSMLEKQKKESEAYVTTVLFDHDIETIHDRVSISEMKPLTEKEYYVRGSTALLDAIGYSIDHIEKVHKYIRKEDCPDSVLFVITTDGMENASRKYTYNKIKDMIETKKKSGWQFIFMGANIDAVQEAGRFGINESMAVNYHADSIGTRKNFDALGKIVNRMMSCPVMEESSIEEELDYVRRDYASRK